MRRSLTALLSEAGESWPLTFCLNLHFETVSLKYAKSLLSYAGNYNKWKPDCSKTSHTKRSESLMYTAAPCSPSVARDRMHAEIRHKHSPDDSGASTSEVKSA